MPTNMLFIVLLPTLVLAAMTGGIEDAVCKNHLDLYLNSIQTEFWAMRMFDSSTKFPEGFTTGLTANLGNFDNCIGIDQKVFTGKYCLAFISYNKSNPSGHYQMVNAERGPSLNFTTMNMTDNMNSSKSIFEMLNMEIAVCVPSTCNVSDIEIFLNTFMNKHKFKASVHEKNCQINKNKLLRPSDWVCVVVFAVFLLLIISSSVYDIITPQGRRRDLLLAFSAISNGRSILASSTSSDTLGVVNGMRIMSLAVVVVAHSNFSILVPTLNFEYAVSFMEDWKHLYMACADLSVDTFLMLSGMLVSYLFMKGVKKTGTFDALRFYVHRFVRLTPLLMALTLFEATLMQYTGSGPLWERTMTSRRESCESNWWVNLLYIQNYLNDNQMCLGHSWYLAVDMQLYVLSPLILIPLWKKPKLGWALMALLMLIGWAVVFLTVYINKRFPIINPLTLPAFVQDTNNGHYLPTHARYTTWLIGVGLGVILHHFKNGDNDIKLTPIQVLLGWSLSTVLMVFSLAMAFPFERRDWTYNVIEAAFFASLRRQLWTLGVAWVVFACATGYGGPVDVLLSWRAFVPLSRISYAIYLVHCQILIIVLSATRTVYYFSESILISKMIEYFFISTAVGFVLSIAFECPFRIIETALLGRRK